MPDREEKPRRRDDEKDLRVRRGEKLKSSLNSLVGIPRRTDEPDKA